jgi:hypothetical protein
MTIVESMISHYADNPPQDENLKLTCELTQRLGAIIRMKLKFHEIHNRVRGNFSLEKGVDLASISKDLSKYLGIVVVETVGVQVGVIGSTEFGSVVLWRPMVDETISAYRLLKSIIPPGTAKRLIYQTELLLWRLPDVPFIAATVAFPTDGEKISVPRERWPGLKSLLN